MSVDCSIECFAFALFRKLWIRNDLPDYAELVPDYPVGPECPDSFCDTVFAFQCLSSSFFEELCEIDYNAFAHSRSDFFYYLAPNVIGYTGKDGLNFNLNLATVLLAVVAAEMGIACARRDNDIFIFSCPLAFAMVFEDSFGLYFHSVGHQTAWGEIFSFDRTYSLVLDLAGIVGRSASSRRDLIYRLHLLRIELDGICPDELCWMLEDIIRTGASMDNSKLPTKCLSPKYYAALFFPWFLQIVDNENYLVYLAPLYAENFIKRHDFLRKNIFQEIANLCCITDEESLKGFFDLYEESVFGEKAVIPPQPKIISVSSLAQELHCLDPNCIVSREMHVDDRVPDNRDAACKAEEFSGILSDTPSLYELYDLKPKNPKSQDNCDLDAGNTEQRPEEHFGIISEDLSLDELNSLKSKDSKFRDSHDVYGLEARDIKHTSEEHSGIISADRFGDAQSNALMMESHSKVDVEMKESYACKSKNISSPSEVYLKSKRADVETDNLENSNFTASETKDQNIFAEESFSECQDEGILSTMDDPGVQDDYVEARVDFETLNKNSSQNTSMVLDSSDEETLFYDCQTSVLDIFPQQYLKLDKNETAFGYSNTLKPNDSEVFHENCSKAEEVLKEPVSSDLPSIKNVYSINPSVEAFSKIESPLETSLNFSADSTCTVVSVETCSLKMPDRDGKKVFQSESKSPSESPREAANPPLELPTTKTNQQQYEGMEEQLIEEANTLQDKLAEKLNTEHDDYENNFCKYKSVIIPSSPESLREEVKLVSREKADSDPKQKDANIINPQLQKSPTRDRQVKSSLTEDDCYELINRVSGAINEDEDKADKGGQKRKNNPLQKKNKQDTGKETEEPTIVVLEKSESIESNPYQLILVMGVPFEKPIKRESRFMERITIESF